MFGTLSRTVVIGLIASVVLVMVAVLFINGSSLRAGAFNEGELWLDTSDPSLAAGDERQIVPEKYRTLSLNKDTLHSLLQQAPLEDQVSPQNSELVIGLPMPDGKFSRFRFVESPIMEDALQAQYPEIRTYNGQGIDDPAATVRFDITPKGFHAMILSQDGSVFIDPYSKNDSDNYISYFKRDFQKEDRSFACLVGNGVPNALEKKHLDDLLNGENELVNYGGTLHTYRLAMAATGEYTAFHGGTVALGLAAITTSVNRVNAVYQRDLSVRLTLIANNNLIVFTNAATDGYTNNDGFAMLTENQTKLTTVIGSANYDVGHVFSTGGGGVASLNSPCSAGSKAQGVTGSPSPVGDPFDIDYVAHEMGHQFGGNHTFNTTTGSCGGGNRAASAAYEPGSASTIQGYAGICGTQDLQRNSDDYFHIRSLEEMTAFINTNACDAESANGNNIPVVTAAAACTVPINTPFELTGSATDANGDALTYTWEEYDLGASTTAIPNTDASGGARPIFRSYKPAVGGATRSFPSLPFILSNANVPPSTFAGTNAVGTVCSIGNCMTGELLPTVSRTMNFQLTARDNRAGGGAIRSANTAVTVSNTSGPFAVTSPNTAVSINGNTNQTVTWNVASTTAAPVSCANVDILLSTNGGTTFPTVLAAATANDGTQTVLFPNAGTTTARVKIKCSTSCFFDISNVNFTMVPASAAPGIISGRIATPAGYGISGSMITLTDTNGGSRQLQTGSFGYFSFDGLEVGQTYILTVGHKRYTFAQPTLVITLNDEAVSVEFVSE